MNMQAPTAAALIAPSLSIVIPVTLAGTGFSDVLNLYRKAVDRLDRPYEVIFVTSCLDAAILTELATLGEPSVRIIQVPQHLGQIGCITEGALRAGADEILILPPFLQIDPSAIPDLLVALASADLVIASRVRTNDARANRVRGWLFRLAARAAGSRFDDLGCLVRAARRPVLTELTVHENHISFLPLLAERSGFRVRQIDVAQAGTDLGYRRHRLPAYIGRGLDILSVGFLMQFLQKPFRFFGAIGSFFILAGLVLGMVLLFQRGASGVPMADRPALLLSVMMVMLGIQIGAVGLIAEVILFTRLPANPVYRIREIVEHDDQDDAAAPLPEMA